MDRRNFIDNIFKGSLLLSSYGLFDGLFAQPVRANGIVKNNTKTIVNIFLPGGLDGANLIIPHGDSAYYDIRPTLGVDVNDTQDLDGFFGINNHASALKNIYDNGDLAVFPATHNDNFSRSHFVAEDHLMSGFNEIQQYGWMNNALQYNQNNNSLRGVSLTNRLNRFFFGKHSVSNFDKIAGYSTSLPSTQEEQLWQIYRDYDTKDKQNSAFVKNFGSTLFKDANTLKLLNDLGDSGPQNGATYNSFNRFEEKLQDAAKLIRNVAPEMIYIQFPGGFDTHLNQRNQDWQLTRVADNINAFYTDLGDLMEDVAILVCTEFGRTARENTNQGTDHGHGAAWLVISKNIRGGIYGAWPGMNPTALQTRYNAIDHTVDNQDIVYSLLSQHMGYQNFDPFWDFNPSVVNNLVKV
jgi:uncharacterized protein (DUF1501 family)